MGDSKSQMADIFWVIAAMSGSSFLGIAMDFFGGSKLISMEGGKGLAYLIHRMKNRFSFFSFFVLKKNLLELHSIHWISRELSGNGGSLKAKSATNGVAFVSE